MKVKAFFIYVLLISALLNRTSKETRTKLLKSKAKDAVPKTVNKALGAGLLWGSRLIGGLGGYFLSSGARDDIRFRIYNTLKNQTLGNITQLEGLYTNNSTMLADEVNKREEDFLKIEETVRKISTELRSRAEKILKNDLKSKI